MGPSLAKLLLEAAVVGVALLVLVNVVRLALRALVPGLITSAVVIVLAGALFHIAAELSGVNAWYVRQY